MVPAAVHVAQAEPLSRPPQNLITIQAPQLGIQVLHDLGWPTVLTCARHINDSSHLSYLCLEYSS